MSKEEVALFHPIQMPMSVNSATASGGWHMYISPFYWIMDD
jgi:hypothetical protein